MKVYYFDYFRVMSLWIFRHPFIQLRLMELTLFPNNRIIFSEIISTLVSILCKRDHLITVLIAKYYYRKPIKELE